MANPSTRAITSHVPVPLADQVDALAARMQRSRAWILRQALTEFATLQERHNRLTLEGLASIDAGEGVRQENVETWIDSLGTDQPLPMRRRRNSSGSRRLSLTRVPPFRRISLPPDATLLQFFRVTA